MVKKVSFENRCLIGFLSDKPLTVGPADVAGHKHFTDMKKTFEIVEHLQENRSKIGFDIYMGVSTRVFECERHTKLFFNGRTMVVCDLVCFFIFIYKLSQLLPFFKVS